MSILVNYIEKIVDLEQEIIYIIKSQAIIKIGIDHWRIDKSDIDIIVVNGWLITTKCRNSGRKWLF